MTVDGAVAYSLLSPLAAARGLAGCGGAGVGRFLPPALLLHGSADTTVPAEGSRHMAEALQALDVRGRCGGSRGRRGWLGGRRGKPWSPRGVLESAKHQAAGCLPQPTTTAPTHCCCLLDSVPQVSASLRVFEGKTHTDLLLEDAFRGGPDALVEAVLEIATGRPHASSHARMVPRPLVWLAARVCPF
jgi:hypothetical protein